MTKLIVGKNDLKTTHPEIAAQWDYEKNGDLKPENVTAGSNKMVYWKCKKGHSWMARIAGRTIEKKGCPICSNQQVLKGYNDLATTHPKIAKEWDYEKNRDLTPENVSFGSGKKVYWKCEKGHSWMAQITGRTNEKRGCPICAGKQILKGYNDLATTHPEIAAQWDYEKNGNTTPEDITAGSNKEFYWKCEKGHSWLAQVNNRIQKNTGCPICSGKQVLKGYNDLATTHPEIAAQWDYEKNGDLKPEDVTSGFNKKVYWECEKEHSWIAVINSRIRNGCPVCANKQVLKGFNDLATTHPELATEWDYEKNGDLKPEDFTYGSEKKIYWKCKKGHSWIAMIKSRNQNGCPICSQSSLETTTILFLEKYHLETKRQIRFEDLRGVRSGMLSYDFGVYHDGKLKYLIECQGEQHYRSTFGNLENQEEHDKRKREYAASIGVPLIEIPYNYTDEEIEEIIREISDAILAEK